MKIKTFIFSGIAGASLFCLYKNREKLKTSYKADKKHLKQAKADIENIKGNLDFLQSQEKTLRQLGQDLAYKLRVFQADSQAHLSEIQHIADKYKTN
ncbi:hypothetical protein [Streptococcus macacae]|uniref:Uncharacterized protein n=1 Tax=Streptococcus macacae NCTC 11558 TaxID=764298 RepID=G5JXY5_9STRE|nr:hypothetical protein [Streptococcus macacae]EHJ52603.1 hypothetical protein STRMA_0030 [Streptococcus macacae NCTC 11558]SUN77903.1 chemotaxis protein [Streptococcus macacae NCTC 11558]